MPTVGMILECLTRLAPTEYKLDFDNIGLLVGSSHWAVHSVMLSLDITGPVIREAAEQGAQLVLSHHPLFFDLRSASSQTPQGQKVVDLLSNRIAAICMHTNLDAADGGVNDALAARLGVLGAKPFEAEHICRIGRLKSPMSLPSFLKLTKERLGCNGLRYVSGDRTVEMVAVGGGSCGSMLEEAAEAGCDTFVTADVKYDVFLRAKELGLNLVDAGHYNTENVVLPVLRDWLKSAFPELKILLSAHRQTEQYYLG